MTVAHGERHLCDWTTIAAWRERSIWLHRRVLPQGWPADDHQREGAAVSAKPSFFAELKSRMLRAAGVAVSDLGSAVFSPKRRDSTAFQNR